MTSFQCGSFKNPPRLECLNDKILTCLDFFFLRENGKKKEELDHTENLFLFDRTIYIFVKQKKWNRSSQADVSIICSLVELLPPLWWLFVCIILADQFSSDHLASLRETSLVLFLCQCGWNGKDTFWMLWTACMVSSYFWGKKLSLQLEASGKLKICFQ